MSLSSVHSQIKSLLNLKFNFLKINMATAKKNNFTAEDFSRFLIREFLKKSGFDRTYDIFMTEDQRPKVTMTKSELTNLLGMDNLVR